MFDEQERMNEMWDDYFAKGDAIRERYASELEDLRQDELQTQAYYDYMQRVHDAGFGDNAEAYEADWARAIEYYDSL